MKKSDQKKLLKSSEKIFNRLTKMQQLIVLIVLVLVFLGYFVFSQSGNSNPFSQEKVIKVNNADALLKLQWNGSDTC